MDATLEDALRYRRLRLLGCAPNDTPHLRSGTVLCFSNLDAFVDADLRAVPDRGEERRPVSRHPTTEDLELLRSLGVGLTFSEPLPISIMDAFLGAVSRVMNRDATDLVMVAGDGKPDGPEKRVRFGVQVKR